MKLISHSAIFFALIMLITAYGFSQKEIPKEDKTYTMEINSKDFIEKITIARQNPSRLKTNNLRWYYWYLNNSVHFSEGGYSGKLLQGSYISYYKNMNLRSNGNFRNGLMHGVWKSWYESGKAKSVVSWKKGVKQGCSTTYSQDGNTRIEEKYRRGLLVGKQYVFENGVLISSKKFRKGAEKISKNEMNRINIDSLPQQPTISEQIDTSQVKRNKTKKEKVSGKEKDTTNSIDSPETEKKNKNATKRKWWPFHSKNQKE